MFGRAIGETAGQDSPVAPPAKTGAEAVQAVTSPTNDAGSDGGVSGASPRSEARSFSERAGSDIEGDSPPPEQGGDVGDIVAVRAGSLDEAAAASRAFISDSGEVYVRRGTMRRPPSRAASLLERDETTEVRLHPMPVATCVKGQGSLNNLPQPL